jgi:hypothetical protein
MDSPQPAASSLDILDAIIQKAKAAEAAEALALASRPKVVEVAEPAPPTLATSAATSASQASSASSPSPTAKKTRPKGAVGRPPKNPINPANRRGIVDAPSKHANILFEMVIDIADLYKDIASLCKALNNETVQVIHTYHSTYIIYPMPDSDEKVELMIAGKHCERYYCKSNCSYSLSVGELRKIFATLKKTDVSTVTWYVPSMENVIFVIEYIDTSKKPCVPLSSDIITVGILSPEVMGHDFIDESQYKIAVQLSSAYFKMKLGIVKNVSSSLIIERRGYRSLAMVYVTRTNGIKNDSIINKDTTDIDDRISDNNACIGYEIDYNKIITFVDTQLSPSIVIKLTGDWAIYSFRLYDGLCDVKMKVNTS